MDRDCFDRALDRLPTYMREEVVAYLEKGSPPCSFLRAVLENDLHKAVWLADGRNQSLLVSWAGVLDALPGNIWGNREKVDQHIESCRRLGEEQPAVYSS